MTTEMPAYVGQRLSGEQMCQAISKWLKYEFGQEVPPEAMWNFSPTGELQHVFHLYDAAAKAGYASG